MDLALPKYPGRCVLVYRDRQNLLWWIYVVTGRSDASRSRRLRFSVDRLFVEPTDRAPRDDLRHYVCARTSPFGVIIGNGDHVDVLASVSTAEAVAAIDPEPDPPIYTPRIAAILSESPTTVVAVKRGGSGVERRVASVDTRPGTGVALHTYAGSVEQVTTDALPRTFVAGDSARELSAMIWESLEPALRVALAYGQATTPEPTAIIQA